MPKNYCIMQIWAESGKSALPICNYSQILYQFLTFTQNLKRSHIFIHLQYRAKIYPGTDLRQNLPTTLKQHLKYDKLNNKQKNGGYK